MPKLDTLPSILAATGPNVRQSLQQYLGQQYHLLDVEKPQDILDAFTHLRPDLLILDQAFPGAEVLEVCRIIREEKQDHLTPIVMILPHDDALIAQALDAGISDWISPPLHARPLRHLLETLLRNRQIETRLQESEIWYRCLFEQNKSIKLIIDLQTKRIIDANPAALSFYGYTIDELKRKSIRDITIATAEETETNLADILSGKRYTLTCQHRTASGAVRDVELLASLMQIDGQTVVYALINDVTKRVEMETALQSSELRFRQIYDNAPVMMFSQDEQGRIIHANRKWLEEMRATAEEVIGQPFEAFVPGGAVSSEAMSEFWETGHLDHFHIQLQRWDGTLFDAVLDSQMMIEQSGLRVCLSVMRNITIEWQVETSLRESENEMRSIFNAMNDLVMVKDRSGRYLKAAPTAGQHKLYIPATDLIGMYEHEVFPRKTADLLLSFIHEALDTQQTIYKEYELILDGESQWWSAAISPIPDEDCVIWVARDITESKKTEAAVRDSEQRYRSLFEFANDAILIIDLLSGQIVDANRMAGRLLGYTQNELRNLTLREIEYIDPDHKTETSTSKLTTSEQLIFEQMYKTRQGNLIPVEVSSRIIKQGGRRLILSLACDIRERRHAHEAERQRRILSEALRETAAAINSTLDLDKVLDLILEYIGRVIPSDAASLMLIEEGTALIQRHWGLIERGYTNVEEIRFPIAETANLRLMVETARPHIINDTANSPEWVQLGAGSWIRAYLGAPIILNGEVIGFINLDRTISGSFSQEDGERLQAFANQASLAIQNARMYERIHGYAAHLEAKVQERTSMLSTTNQQLKEQIIERERVEVKLGEERALLQTLIDNLPDEVYVKDLENRIITANQKSHYVSHLYGRKLQIGEPAPYPSENQDKLGRILDDEKALHNEEKRIITYEQTIVDNTGGIRWFSVTKTPIRDLRGKIMGLLVVNHDITDIKRAEEQLRQIISSARCLLWFGIVEEKYNSLDWHIYVTNDNAARQFLPVDLKPGQDFTQAWLDSRFPEDIPAMEQLSENALRAGELGYSHEYRCQLADGSLCWLSEDVQITPLTPGRWSVVGVCIDITERRKARETLERANIDLEKRVIERTAELSQANESLLVEVHERKRAEKAERDQRMFAEALRDAADSFNQTLDLEQVMSVVVSYISRVVPEHDSDSILLLESDTLARCYYYRRKIDGEWQRYYDNLRDSNVPDFPNLHHMLTTARPVVVPNTRNDSNWIEVDYSTWIHSYVGSPIMSGGKVIGFINLCSAQVDTFDRSHADRIQAFANQAGVALQNARLMGEIRQYASEQEARVAERTAELQYQHSQLQAILNAMQDGVYYTDESRIPQYVNDALIRMTGYDREEWLSGRYVEKINTSKTEDRDQFWNRIEKTLERQSFSNTESKLRRYDGSLFDANLARTAVRDPEGNILGIVTVMRDISQAKMLEEQKSRFIAYAAHELRTPIANLKTRLYLMRRQPEKLLEHLQIGEAVINWMQTLVQNMFDVSRFERGVIELDREELVLQEILTLAHQFHLPEASQKQIALSCTLPEGEIIIIGDKSRLTQVITNLVSNAIHYTPEGGRVEVRLATEERRVLIDVIDTGVGIGQEHLEFLFEPFYRATQDGKGAGLGLSIAREIVRLHQGDLTVESTVGKGSHFTVTLPF